MECDLFICLGCFGLTTNHFISCPSVENVILNVNPSLFKYNELMDYLDQNRLFDKLLLEYNAINHFIYNLQDKFDQSIKPLFSSRMYELYQKFISQHRNCGLYIKLLLPEQNAKIEEKPKIIDTFPKLRLLKK